MASDVTVRTVACCCKDTVKERFAACFEQQRRYLEQEFQAQELRFPTGLVETTSAFATLSLLQRNPSFVALLSTEVATVLSGTEATTILSIDLHARSEPYYLVKSEARTLSPVASWFWKDVLERVGDHLP